MKTILKTILSGLKHPYYWIRKNRISWRSYVSSNVFLNRTKIGCYCYIGNNCIINNTIIGNYSSIAPAVQIGGMEHSHWAKSTSTFLSDEGIVGRLTIIEEDVWIGAGSIVKQGVRIGKGAVIGANSFVNRDVEPYSIVVGSPAKFFKYRFDNKMQSKLLNSQYWLQVPQKARTILDSLD